MILAYLQKNHHCVILLFLVIYSGLTHGKKAQKIQKTNCQCGISNVDEKRKSQIHPWQVLLIINWKNTPKEKDNYCQGVLVSKKHILTAVRCLFKKRYYN